MIAKRLTKAVRKAAKKHEAKTTSKLERLGGIGLSKRERLAHTAGFFAGMAYAAKYIGKRLDK